MELDVRGSLWDCVALWEVRDIALPETWVSKEVLIVFQEDE